MTDAEKNVENKEVAPPASDAQSEQAAPAEKEANAPVVETPTDKEEKIAGKFKSEEDLDKATSSLDDKIAEYERKEAQFTKQRQVDNAPVQEQVESTPQDFDPETKKSLKTWYETEREKERAKDFTRNNADDLKDPLIKGAVIGLMNDARAKGIYLNQDDALKEAKTMVSERTKPEVEKARSEGVEEGRDISKTKEQLGAVGDTGKKEKVDPSQLTAEEFAKFHAIPDAEE